MEIILMSAFAATTTMTLFSYAISASFRKLYKEPLLLQFLMIRLDFKPGNFIKATLAWLIHYMIGFVFVLGFHYILFAYLKWNLFLLATVFGFIIGIAGIVGWNIMFATIGKPRQTDLFGYYFQLFIAHCIFAFTVILCYYLAGYC